MNYKQGSHAGRRRTIQFVPGDVSVLVMSHMNGLQPFESTIEQTTETMPSSHKTITAATNMKQ